MDERREEEFQSREVVEWYIPACEEAVSYYVQPTPLPEKARPMPAKSRKKRRGLWAFIIIMAVLIAAAAAGVIWQKTLQGARDRTASSTNWSKEDGTASSIVNIFDYTDTTIPRFTGDPAVHLTIEKAVPERMSAGRVYTEVMPATVAVMTQIGEEAMLGTGIIMTEDGYVLTNAHVISGGEYCLIKLWNGVTYEAELVGMDVEEDLAVLHAVDAMGLPVAHFGSSNSCCVGDTVYAIGNPLGLELQGTLTDGIISAIDRDVTIDGQTMTMIQTTAALNNGNSGGPLINDRGQVIGINTLKMSHTITEQRAGVEGLGFAIPVSDAAPIVNCLIADGIYRGAPSLGVTIMTVSTTDGGTTVVIIDVEKGRGGDKAGLQPGDVILSADGVDISRTEELLELRQEKHIGDIMHLRIFRGDEILEMDVTMMTNRY